MIFIWRDGGKWLLLPLTSHVIISSIAMTELILITISGHDHPGVTASLSAILASHNAAILDIGQSNIHHVLSLGFLIKTDSDVSGDIMKDILFKSYELGVDVKFTPVDLDEYSRWVGRQGRKRWIITILGRHLNASHIADVSRVIAEQELNIDAIRRLTGRIPLDEDPTESDESRSKQCVEFSVRGNPLDRSAMQDAFMQIASKGEVDISLQEDNMYRRCRRLICFDMDSTLIGTEVIDELAERAGVGDKVKAITESAMRGEIDFNESFRERVALLKGLDVSVMQEIAENLPINEGLERLMTVLKRSGYKTAILSGGFTFFGNYLKRRFGFDYVYANDLEIDSTGHLTGRALGEIVNGRRKAELLKVMAQVEQVDIQQTVAVGDGANDLPMLSTAGLGIAFHAKPKVKANADQSLSTIGLDGILYFLGFKDSLIQA